MIIIIIIIIITIIKLSHTFIAFCSSDSSSRMRSAAARWFVAFYQRISTDQRIGEIDGQDSAKKTLSAIELYEHLQLLHDCEGLQAHCEAGRWFPPGDE